MLICKLGLHFLISHFQEGKTPDSGPPITIITTLKNISLSHLYLTNRKNIRITRKIPHLILTCDKYIRK